MIAFVFYSKCPKPKALGAFLYFFGHFMLSSVVKMASPIPTEDHPLMRNVISPDSSMVGIQINICSCYIENSIDLYPCSMASPTPTEDHPLLRILSSDSSESKESTETLSTSGSSFSTRLHLASVIS